uniref:ISL3 family transposase n=1 Tax=Acrocarpospora catenulata TaxID=2836182 RepID=UPI001BD9DD81
YQRRLIDTAIGGRETVIHLRVRRFVCDTMSCAKKTFAEQIDGLTWRYGRQSIPARRELAAIALAVGGRAGARLSARLASGVGRMTLIRLIRALPEPPVATPRVLGVDDFALRRGHRYGTVLVDMTTRRVIDVLDDRTADSLAAWLDARPGVEVICRDRAGSYAEAATRAVPGAIQVADRWHLLHNLSQAVEKAVARHRSCLRPAGSDPVPQIPAPPVVSATPVDGVLARRTRARHAEIHALREQGLGIYTIARLLKLDPKTVHRYADVPDAEQLINPGGVRDSILNPFKPYLHQRCLDGVTGTTRLLEEIRARGYRGSERTLRRYLISVRGVTEAVPAPPRIPTSRDITAWIMRPPGRLTADDHAELERLCVRCQDLDSIRDLARGFADLVRTRTAAGLDSWVSTAQGGSIAEIRSFANGLRKDWMAVTAGLTLAWSSGAVEGAVNRIKMLKRQMYGRANPDLLRRRILLAD